MARDKSSDSDKQAFWIILALVIAVLLFGGFLSKEQVAVEAGDGDHHSYKDKLLWAMEFSEELGEQEEMSQLTDDFEEETNSQCTVGKTSSSSFMSPCLALSYEHPNETVETIYPGGPGCKPIVCYLKKAEHYHIYPTCDKYGNPVSH